MRLKLFSSDIPAIDFTIKPNKTIEPSLQPPPTFLTRKTNRFHIQIVQRVSWSYIAAVPMSFPDHSWLPHLIHFQRLLPFPISSPLSALRRSVNRNMFFFPGLSSDSSSAVLVRYSLISGSIVDPIELLHPPAFFIVSIIFLFLHEVKFPLFTHHHLLLSLSNHFFVTFLQSSLLFILPLFSLPIFVHHGTQRLFVHHDITMFHFFLFPFQLYFTMYSKEKVECIVP